jgi:hypothetical protein
MGGVTDLLIETRTVLPPFFKSLSLSPLLLWDVFSLFAEWRRLESSSIFTQKTAFNHAVTLVLLIDIGNGDTLQMQNTTLKRSPLLVPHRVLTKTLSKVESSYPRGEVVTECNVLCSLRTSGQAAA